MKYYGIIDTNVLVSAVLNWNSVPGKIMELVFSGIIIPALNQEVLKEYREVLLRDKFHLTEEIVDDIIDAIEEISLNIIPEKLDIELPDVKDRVFYEITMELREEEAYLVTGNIKHFPEEEFIVTPREMLDIVLKNIDELI